VAVPYNDETLLPVNDTWHPKIDDVVYNAMDWDCPGYNQVQQGSCVRVIVVRGACACLRVVCLLGVTARATMWYREVCIGLQQMCVLVCPWCDSATHSNFSNLQRILRAATPFASLPLN
jgi:hypothetical protein